ncbi:MAG: dihydroorotase [Bacteroidia bacterium]|nr:dihydroorotase [Bacteroidia bacterium]
MSILIRNARILNEGQITEGDLLVRRDRIDRIGGAISAPAAVEIDAAGAWLMPGVIDDQVHFREPGLTHKADLTTESRAAVAGGMTTYMEMPNTQPQAVTQELLAAKYARAAEVSRANYSFFMGATNGNLDELLRTDPQSVCGIKIFMGSSTGNMLVDEPSTLESIFRESPVLIAVHCEDEQTVRTAQADFQARYGEAIPVEAHPLIRSREACLRSSSLAVSLAQRYGTRLHVLHISTAEELALFRNDLPLEAKQITAEACLHHLWFSDEDYARLGSRIKWNPAVKTAADRSAIRQAVLDGRIDVIATDHAPHTLEEKAQPYLRCPSGGPLVQHSLVAMLELAREGWITPLQVADKLSHAPARCFRIRERGFIREGYFADLVLVDPDRPWTVTPDTLLYKCGWSPLEGQVFHAQVRSTVVSGQLAWHEGQVQDQVRGQRISFDR